MSDPACDPGLLIAPCGMNCGICIGFLRSRNQCPGCHFLDKDQSRNRRKCVIRNCEYLDGSTSGFCYECPKYPCARLKRLDKRYRTKYRMSMIGNLENVKLSGLERFLDQENSKWTCCNCKSRLSAHRESCLECGQKAVL